MIASKSLSQEIMMFSVAVRLEGIIAVSVSTCCVVVFSVVKYGLIAMWQMKRTIYKTE